jgi:Domain of unknown function (DUF3482)/50S ribosome-binding GTPase
MAGATIHLSLISHTNVGKTTLARTLLGRDIGEVRDEAHVTLAAEPHLLLEAAGGERLMLWDTPGFGDSVRLARRLAQAGNPIGWFMSEVWDRWRDRAFWAGQKAVRNVLDEADAVLYLVNAAEAPEEAAFVDAELKVLALVGKPVIVLLNQLGAPKPPAAEAADVQRWHERLKAWAVVRDVIALDAFARCWVQEGTLLARVQAVLPAADQGSMQRLREAWEARGRATWKAAMAVLARRIARAALDTAQVDDAGIGGRLREMGAALGLRREGRTTPREAAMLELAERLDAQVRSSTDELIRLHGLDGRASHAVLLRMAEHFAAREPVSEGKAAMVGGLVTGALAGLKADIATGGLTLGGGMLAGGLIGALGAMGVARGVNIVRGVEQPTLAWSDAVLDELFRSALVGYLAVAHFGRGRGNWAASEHPPFWQDEAGHELQVCRLALQAIWERRARARDDGAAGESALTESLTPLLERSSAAMLVRIYPDAPIAQLQQPGA